MILDVNLGGGRTENIVIYEGESCDKIVQDFTRKHNLSKNKEAKLQRVIES